MYQYFKYFDINSTGASSFQDFIKVNKKLGIVNNITNLEKIFLYFAEPDTSFLIYKKFCQNIFYYFSPNKKDNLVKNKNNNYYIKESFIDILTRKILEKRGNFTLLELIKNIKIIDYENSNIIFFNDFINALKRTNIILTEEEKEAAFIHYDFLRNKNLHYHNMINLLINQFWTEEKNRLCEELFLSLTNYGKQCISIYHIQKLFKNLLNDKNDFIDFIEKYILINKNNSLEPISLKDFIILFKYYCFGEYNPDFLKQMNYLINKNNSSNNNYNCNCDKYSKINNYFNHKDIPKIKVKHNYSKSVEKEITENNVYNKNNNINKIISKIKSTFIEYGRKSFFNFIKQFKYYETNDNLITRNNFRKVFTEFNIKLTSEEIDSIFNKFGIDYSKNYLYHEDFIKYISVKYLNKKRDNLIKYIYEVLFKNKGKNNNDITIQYLKDEYNAKNNYFIKNETDNYLEFIDCLEIYHFCYKGNKYDTLSQKEFVEFYRLISFLINNDNDFINLISNEWRINNNYLNSNFSTKEENGITNNNKINFKEENYFLVELKNELIKKGVKGLLNIHWNFLRFCSDVSRITLNDFINIMNLNHINFTSNEFKDIFNYFSNNTKYLDYNRLIRFFKKELNESKLNIVEKIFLSLKYENSEENDEVPLYILKIKYKAKKHPDVIGGRKTEDEKIKEFKECFDINYNIFNTNTNYNNSMKLVDFDMFANFYEYVSFIYDDDKEFKNLLISTWC